MSQIVSKLTLELMQPWGNEHRISHTDSMPAAAKACSCSAGV